MGPARRMRWFAWTAISEQMNIEKRRRTALAW
jgi:hypothetical protein